MQYDRLVKEASQRLALFAATAKRMRQYYNGDQANRYLTHRNTERYGSLFREFRENLCRPVVEASVSRLILDGVRGDGGAADQAIADAFARWDLDVLQRRIHRDALVLGRSWLIFWPEPDGTVKPHWNPGDVVEGVWDPDDPSRLLAAVKRWDSLDESGKPLTRTAVYYEDRVERFAGEGLAPYSADGQEAVQYHRFGRVPVVKFGLEQSDLTDVVPIQDALNKAGYDLLVGMEFSAMQQRYVTGLDSVEIDPATGRMRDPFGPGGLWIVGNPDAKFGTLEPGDLGQMRGVSDQWRLAVARIARVPLHYLVPSGDFPSGEALKTAEAPFASKLDGLREEFGESWETAARLLVGLPDDAPLRAVWRDTTPRSEVEQWNVAATKHLLGVSKRQILREMGYTEDEVTRILDERAEEDAEREASRARAAGLGPILPPAE